MARPIVAIGEIVVEIMAQTKGDGFTDPIDLKGPYPSGAPAIFINQAACFGYPTAMISSVGDDDFGRININRLSGHGVDVSGIDVHGGETTASAFVRYREDGTRKFVFNIIQSACRLIALDDHKRALLAGARHLHVMGSSLFSQAAIDAVLEGVAIIKHNGGTVSFDPNVRADLARSGTVTEALRTIFASTDIFLPSGEEAMLFSPDAQTPEDALAQILASRDIEIVLKNGAAGARVKTRDTDIAIAPMRVKEVDPTGAGDSFGGTYVAARLSGLGPSEAVRYSNVAGALAVSRMGPMEGASDRARIETHLLEMEAL